MNAWEQAIAWLAEQDRTARALARELTQPQTGIGGEAAPRHRAAETRPGGAMHIFEGVDQERYETQFAHLDPTHGHIVDREVNNMTVGNEKVSQTIDRKVLFSDGFVGPANKASWICAVDGKPALKIRYCETCRKGVCSCHSIIVGQTREGGDAVVCPSCWERMEFERDTWAALAVGRVEKRR